MSGRKARKVVLGNEVVEEFDDDDEDDYGGEMEGGGVSGGGTFMEMERGDNDDDMEKDDVDLEMERQERGQQQSAPSSSSYPSSQMETSVLRNAGDLFPDSFMSQSQSQSPLQSQSSPSTGKQNKLMLIYCTHAQTRSHTCMHTHPTCYIHIQAPHLPLLECTQI
jgi:hypothetical protein